MLEREAPDPWGSGKVALNEGRPVAPLPARLAGLVALDGPRLLTGPEDPWGRKPRPEELPEVVELAARGWRAMPLLPPCEPVVALWPEPLRGWMPDRRPHVGIIGFGVRRHVEPAQWNRHAEQAGFARQAGLPRPPPGRLWLLRSPWPSVGVEVVIGLIWRRARASGLRVLPRAARVAAEEMLDWSEQQLWDWWPEDQHVAVAREWAADGQVGEEVAELIAAGAGPEALPLLLEDGGLTRSQAARWMRATRAMRFPR